MCDFTFTIEVKVDLDYIVGTVAMALTDGWDLPETRNELEEMTEIQLRGGGTEACKGWEYAYEELQEEGEGLPPVKKLTKAVKKLLDLPTS
jgi:hypothetical protein